MSGPSWPRRRVLRRLRLGVDAQWKRLTFEFNYDLHDSIEHLKNLNGDIKISKAFHITGGKFKLPVSPEWMTTAAKIDFIERSLVVDALAPGRDWGVQVGGDVKRVTYFLGVFEGDGQLDESRADTTVAGRLEAGVLKGLELGVSASQGKVNADPRRSRIRCPAASRSTPRRASVSTSATSWTARGGAWARTCGCAAAPWACVASSSR